MPTRNFLPLLFFSLVATAVAWAADGILPNRRKYGLLPAPPITMFVTTPPPFGSLSQLNGWYGMKITMGATTKVLTHVGIWGNLLATGTIDIQVVTSSGGFLSMGTCAWGTAAQWYWVDVNDVNLWANSVFFIMCNPGYQYIHSSGGTLVYPTAIGTINDAAFSQPPFAEGYGANHAYGPVNFQYIP